MHDGPFQIGAAVGRPGAAGSYGGLIVGTSGVDDAGQNAGALYSYFSSGGGALDPMDSQVIPGNAADEWFGANIIEYDLDADGTAEILVGARGAGEIRAFSLTDDSITALTPGIFESDGVGRTIDSADFNGDGVPDIVAGTQVLVQNDEGFSGAALWLSSPCEE